MIYLSLLLVGDKRSESRLNQEMPMAKQAKKGKRVEWTKAHERELKDHSRKKTPVKAIAKTMKRTPGALRQKAHAMGVSLGHRR